MPFHALSGGQRQRVLLARALASSPDCLLLDEPTAGVDRPTQHALAEMLGDLHRSSGRTVVLVTHEFGPFRKIAGRFVWVQDGSLHELTAGDFNRRQDQPEPHELMPEEFLFGKALCAAVMIGVLLPIVGRHLVLGRAVLLGLAIPQIAMAGIAFVFLGASRHWPWAESLHEESAKALVGSLLFGLPGLLLIATPWKRHARISEAWLAVVYLASVSATNLMLATDAVGETYLGDLFHGRLLFIGEAELKLLGITLAAGFLFLFAFRRRLLLTLTDPDYASVAGLAVGGWTVAATVVNGTVIGITVATAGPLVAFGFLVLPVLTAGDLRQEPAREPVALHARRPARFARWILAVLSLRFPTRRLGGRHRLRGPPVHPPDSDDSGFPMRENPSHAY